MMENPVRIVEDDFLNKQDDNQLCQHSGITIALTSSHKELVL